ncbi:MAG: triose-phosphate isomerase [Endomicrobium sp.]|jgi:triosephosphate isomerase|nr:triose-phosphate isomerase [Endomicrobium sp.]
MRKPMIVGNWKMNKTISDAVLTVKMLKDAIDVINIDILICPSFTMLYIINNEIKESNIKLGAQNIFWESSGAFTGEISSTMVKDVGCSYVILGHSERRQHFSETNEMINKKVKAAFMVNIIPIVCIGETANERENNATYNVIENQIKGSLYGLSLEQASSVIIAYEPIWAIGTGKNASSEQIQNMHLFIRKTYCKMYGESVSNNISIIYGGSVNLYNISDIIKQPDVDGCLVGGASLNAKSFAELVKCANKEIKIV